MTKRRQVLIALLITVACPTLSRALTPDEVLVVANAGSDDSVELARFYAKLRKIPDQNVLLVKTTTAYEVARDDYETQIRRPVLRHLAEKNLIGKVKCLVLMYGVPVRVAAGASSAIYKSAATKARYRLAICRQLLTTVGKKFPQPRTKQLKPFGLLFATKTKDPTTTTIKLKDFKKQTDMLLQLARENLERIDDPANRRIASRQLAALHLEMFGLSGLIAYVEKETPPSTPNLDDLKRQFTKTRAVLAKLRHSGQTDGNAKARVKLLEKLGGALLVASLAAPPGSSRKVTGADAAVDSEMALIFWPAYKLDGPLKNPLHWQVQAKLKGKKIPPVLMTARIDGPTKSDAMAIITASVETEKTGLKGKCYIDSGGKLPAYDLHLGRLYTFVRANTKIDVVLDEKKSLFPKGSCPDAALYVGWYSLKKYIPAFTWVRGSVGWHVASFEAMDLRNPDSPQWCPQMIRNGVAATVGAVNEPFLHSFPLPEEFFPLLLTGKWTVAECYWRTVPMTSWRMTLIADPLYNPFAANPQVDPRHLPEDLAPG